MVWMPKHTVDTFFSLKKLKFCYNFYQMQYFYAEAPIEQEGKLFALDENTADMIQKAKDMKDSIQEKIDKVRAAKEFATNMDEAVLDRYNTILGQLEASDAQARSIVEQRGWTFGKDNADNDSDGDGYEKYYLGDRQVEIISKDSSSINISNNNDNKNTNNKIAGTSADSEYADSDDEYYYSGRRGIGSQLFLAAEILVKRP